MIDREKGPVELLCKEIGFPFDKRMERLDIFASFMRVLVVNILHMSEMAEQLAKHMPLPGPSSAAVELISEVFDVLDEPDAAAMSKRASEIQWHAEQPEEGPCDHLVDMLGSCISAIWFGLEKPCRSRHAAAAASHIWRRLYRIGREDRMSYKWQKEWAYSQMQEAILRLAIERREPS